MSIFDSLPSDWAKALAPILASDDMSSLDEYLAEEYENENVFPPKEEVFAALSYTPLSDVRVVLLGQDPYHKEGQAHGLAFSVRRGVRVPPSLRNIYKELNTDLGVEIPKHGFLEAWAERGVLMLNTSLTVREGKAGSHARKGWWKFTDAIIEAVNDGDPTVFILWGAHARKKAEMIDESKHKIVQSPHPSPLSAKTGFFDSKPFSKVNTALADLGREPISWDLPE